MRNAGRKCGPVTRKVNKPRNLLLSLKMASSGVGSPGHLVQYIVVRLDLVHKLSWPLGAVITQACHAASAAIHLHYTDTDTQRYLADLDSMHKVVLGVRQIHSRLHSVFSFEQINRGAVFYGLSCFRQKIDG